VKEFSKSVIIWQGCGPKFSGTFVMVDRVAGAVAGWRPAFKYYSMWLSLIGAVLCIGVMFIMSWVTALVTMAVIAVLFFYLHYHKPGTTTKLWFFSHCSP